MLEGLSILDERKRATLHLFYAEELTVAEIAGRRRQSASAVKMELLRARRELSGIVRKLLNKKSQ